ncbi:MAG: HupE/UreJ family protein [Alphaproteobacteria bacterium]
MRLLLTLLVCGLALWGGPVWAHDSRPLYVEIVERDGGAVDLSWKTPATVADFNLPVVALGDGCKRALPPRLERGGLTGQVAYHCAGGLSGQALAIDYPRYNPSLSTMVRVNFLSGEVRTLRGSPNESVVQIPEAETAGGVAWQYGVLGVEHILLGYDHLLFLACLVLIAGTLRRVVITVTGFTLAHSITLILASLDVVRLPIPPVEAVIALSIVFLATELARDRRDTLTWRYPIAVSASFGLLHGFGFASVLSEIGLPSREVSVALLSFNLGVEVGQLMFIAVLMPLLVLLGRIVGDERIARPVAYVVGPLAAFWMVERIAGFTAA